MKHAISARSTGLDVVRCIAVFCVIAVHFFLNTGFYDKPVIGLPMLAMTILRCSFMICVPLFMILTGYLVNSKTPNLKYYFKILRIIYVYIFASFLCALYRKYIMHTDISYFGIIACMFSFDIAPYSWYIEMYMGLFLLIPFLNILYDALETQKSKRILIATFLVLTMLPSVFNIYCIAGIHWWLKPSSQTNYFPLVPSWWQGVYPITYFYLGKYLKEFPLKLSALQKIFASLFIIIFSGIYNYYRSYGSIFLWGDWQDYGSFLVTLQAVLVFSLFANIDYSKVSAPFKHLFAIISNLSLGAYLISWIPDQIVYGYLNQIVPKMENRIYYFIPATFTVLISSLLLSAMINGLYPIICRVFSKIMPGSKTTHSS